MAKLITVFSATGHQGSSVICTILRDEILSKEFRIRGKIHHFIMKHNIEQHLIERTKDKDSNGGSDNPLPNGLLPEPDT
ncbi:hypothetical protein BJX64DRAFT_268648 [Aspergillus heterothallicus]